MKRFRITTLALVSVGWATAQDVPPLEPLRGDAASLKDTMKFIKDKLPGKVNYVIYGHNNITGTDQSVKKSTEISGVAVRADLCSIVGHAVLIDQGKTIFDGQFDIPLKLVQEILLQQVDQSTQQQIAEAGHPEITITVIPPVSAIIAKSSSAKTGTLFAMFFDATLADRVTKALQHAVDLCGGGNKDPF